MSDRVMSGFSRTNRIRLPEDTISIDSTTPLGASTMNTIMKANKTGDYSNVGNALTVYSSVKQQDLKDDVFVTRTETITTVSDKAGSHNLTDSAMVKTYCDQGFKITKTIQRYHKSDGSIVDK